MYEESPMAYVAATMIDIIHVSQDPLGVQMYYFPQGHLQHNAICLHWIMMHRFKYLVASYTRKSVAATMIDIIHVSQDPLGVQMYYFPQGHLQHVLESIKLLFAVAGTMIFTGLHIFKLAGASLSMAFVNVTGFSVISGLGMAMDGITSQAFGAQPILVFFGQDPKVASLAATYTYFTIPTLFLQCFFHPIKVYLRAKKVTKPFIIGATLAVVFHVAALMLMSLVKGKTFFTSHKATWNSLLLSLWVAF
ncbi:protein DETOXIFICATION 49 [Artemisia annua]|uniref:Protein DETOXIFICATION 49 n=1 Tax=Artemisia annua TaxID=35608 RepID=A0A2U1LS23_ARTAN|nr:protein DETOXIFICATION 49 [Artemisia annua]